MTLRPTLSAAFGLALAGCSATAPTMTADPAPAAGATIAVPATENPTVARRYQATITPAELAGHLYVYADDHLAGRETGEPGQRFAARYLAGQYQTMGVGPKGSGTSDDPYGLDGYLQPFELEQEVLRGLTVTAMRDGATFLTSTIGPDDVMGLALAPAYGSVDDASPARLVYVGDATALDGLALDGAYALMVPGEGGRAAMRGGLNALGAAGVRAALVASAPEVIGLAEMAGNAFRGGRLALPSDGTEEDAGGLPPIFFTGLDIADALAPTRDAPGETGVMLAIEADQEVRRVPTENVVALIEGSDPLLRDEVVVISAHLDHVGDGGDGADRIYNGADDDGSGTVAMLEIAEAFQIAKRDGYGPRRSVLFLHVTGEEKGLLGSAYYADREPLMPIEDTVANLNIDMIGRYDPERGFDTTDYVYIIGGDLISQDLHDWNEAVNGATGTDLFLSDRFNSPDDPNQFFRRSDHWNFGKYDVPFIFYFTGTHEDYHGVGDSADKIDYDRLARIARLVFGTAWEVANTDERPAVSGVGFN